MSLIKKINKLFSKTQSMHVVGLSLRQQSLAFCHVSEGNNFHCQLVDKNSIVSALASLKEEHQLEGACHIVLSAEQYHIIQVDKPNVPEAEINSALKWQIKDLVPYTPDNMVLDYFDGPILSGGAQKINVVCAALSELKKMVEQLENDGFNVESITTAEFAFAKLVPVQNDACLLVCQQGKEEILLLIVQQGRVYFHRRLRGFSQISTKSEEELSEGIIDSLSLELQRTTDYFERQLKQAPIRQIKIIVPMKNELFFARKLAENTNIPIELLSLGTKSENFRECATAIGVVTPNTEDEVL